MQPDDPPGRLPFPRSRVGSASPRGAGKLAPGQPLTAAQQRWVDSTLASLSLRQRIGQMVSIWVMGDYANERDPGYAQLVDGSRRTASGR